MNNKSLSEQVTYSTVLIKCRYKDGSDGSGTGFIMNLCCDKKTNKCIPVIITNKHVIENSAETFFEICKSDEDGNAIDEESISFCYKTEAWIPHPDLNIDLCCLPIGDTLNQLHENDLKVCYIALETDLIPTDKQLSELSAMEDVIMVGYPIGLSDQYNHKPIIRRGITSTHPSKDYQGKPETLLDIACFPGSSGSPVFIWYEGTYKDYNAVHIGNKIYLLGILYGIHQFDIYGDLKLCSLPNTTVPITHNQIPVNLGVMIKSKQIKAFEELLDNNQEVSNG